jgi:hypothetical protein
MPRLNFGAFLAPHHPVGEHPMLQLRRDLDLVEHLDRLGYGEFWSGEHHSSGWKMIASPEMFPAATGRSSARPSAASKEGKPNESARFSTPRLASVGELPEGGRKPARDCYG